VASGEQAVDTGGGGPGGTLVVWSGLVWSGLAVVCRACGAGAG
jgi:hypothetical protein